MDGFSDLSLVSAGLKRARDFYMRGKGKMQCDTSHKEKRVCVRGKGVRHMLKLGLSASASQIATVKTSV